MQVVNQFTRDEPGQLVASLTAGLSTVAALNLLLIHPAAILVIGALVIFATSTLVRGLQ
jgi:hypothetical protein